MKIASVAAAVAVLALVSVRPHLHRHGLAAAAEAAPPAGLKPLDPAVVPPMVVGMNLGSPVYWSSEESFADPLKVHGQLFLAVDGQPELTNQLRTDRSGKPVDVPAGTTLIALVQSGQVAPAVGSFDCTVSPDWAVKARATALVSQHGTRFTLTIPPRPASNDVQIQLTATRDGAALSELGCHPRDLPASALYRPDFLADMKPFAVIRFMDWMKTNNAPHQVWADRPLPADLSQIARGVSVEDMVALANTLGADPWFTLPFDADDDYYRQFATYVRDHLAPGRKAYVELSNEVWNLSFEQAKQAERLGKARYPSAEPYQAADFYYADRVRDFMAVWSEVFAGQRQRIVRVIASQAAASNRAEDELSHKETWRSVDALAIAPYFGGVPADVPGKGPARIEAVLAHGPADIDEALGWGRANKAVANRYGVPLVAYEGGPGYFGFDPEMRQDMVAVSHDPRMYALYTRFLERWRKEVGGLLVLFDGTNTGPFAHKDYTGQPLSDAPKMRAVVDFIGRSR